MCGLGLNDNIFGLFLRISSRVFHILMADNIHDINEILVWVNGVEKLLLFLWRYPEVSLTNRGFKSAIYDETSPLLSLYIK